MHFQAHAVMNDFQVSRYCGQKLTKRLTLVVCCNCRKGPWSEGLSWAPSHSPPGHGKCRAPLTCRCTALQHHQDSLPPPAARAAACRCRLALRRRSSRTTTNSCSPRPLGTRQPAAPAQFLWTSGTAGADLVSWLVSR